MQSSPRIRPLAALAAVGLSLALLASAAPAKAEDLTTRDPAGDVVKHANDDEAPGETVRSNKSLDITRFDTRFRHGRLKLTTEVRRLPRADYLVLWRLVSPGRDYILVFDPRKYPPFNCAHIPCRADRDTDSFTVSIPRHRFSASDEPKVRWVRTGALVVRYGEKVTHSDDARRKAASHLPIKLGKRVHHN